MKRIVVLGKAGMKQHLDYEFCHAARPATDPPQIGMVYFCTLPVGHTGNHIAHLGGYGEAVQEWPQS